MNFIVSNKKWLLLGNYNHPRPPSPPHPTPPPPLTKSSFIYQRIKFCLEFFFSPMYEKFVLLGDFNMSTKNTNLKNFIRSFGLDSLIDSPTCYKSINPTCIDLILTNKKNHFMKSTTYETGLPDRHKPTTAILKKAIK